MMRRILSALLVILMLPACALAEVASGDETVEAVEVVEEGMVPIYGDSINDGTYSVTVDSSSSMFNIVSCTLTVENGVMTAVMTMSGTGYVMVFMGTGEEAVAAESDEYILFDVDEDGANTFTVPVEALDMGIDCAAFSKRKEKWYERTLLFRADSLPLSAFKEGTLTDAASLGLEDGDYTVECALVGDSGSTTVESPAQLRIEDGAAYATVVWSSSKYDYMIVDEETYLPVNTEGNAAFEIPVASFDWNIAVIVDSTALGTPREMSYSIRFDADTIEPSDGE